MDIDLTVSIVNWNNKDYLKGCLQSIFDNTEGIDYEVIVADNASCDKSAQMIKDNFPNVRLIENEINFGYARANNQVFAIAKGRYFLLLNPDTVIPKGSLSDLCKFLDEHPQAGAVAPKYLNPDGTFQPYYQRLPTFMAMLFKLTYLNKIFPRNKFVRSHYMRDVEFNATMEVEQPATSCLLVRKGVLGKTLFDEHFPLLWNDVDLCKRIAGLNYKLYYFPGVSIIHYKGKGIEAAGKSFNPEYYKSLFRYFKKHKNLIELLALWLAVFLNQIILCAVSFIKIIFGKNKLSGFKRDIQLLFRLVWPKEEFRRG